MGKKIIKKKKPKKEDVNQIAFRVVKESTNVTENVTKIKSDPSENA
jgi:hypothetical protein